MVLFVTGTRNPSDYRDVMGRWIPVFLFSKSSFVVVVLDGKGEQIQEAEPTTSTTTHEQQHGRDQRWNLSGIMNTGRHRTGIC